MRNLKEKRRQLEKYLNLMIIFRILLIRSLGKNDYSKGFRKIFKISVYRTTEMLQ